MNTVDTSEITSAVAEAISEIACTAEESCRKALKRAYDRAGPNSAERFALGVMNDNFTLAADEMRPVCQDTGMAVIFVELGQDVRLVGAPLEDAINAAVAKSYAPLRKSVLDPVTRINTRDNTPAVIHVSIKSGDGLKLEVMLKGFGSENMSRVYMLNPAQGLDEAKRLIVETVREAASNPCPPVIVGIGLGGTFEKACLMSKHALTRKLGSLNPDTTLNAMEEELSEQINALGIGAQGFGGNTSTLGVFIESYPTHISSLPVAVNILCHCSRCKSVVLR